MIQQTLLRRPSAGQNGGNRKEEGMKMRVLAVAMVTAVPLMAAEPVGFVIWPASDLKAYGRKLAPKMNAGKVAAEGLATFGNHLAMIAHREGDGEAELHETQADVFVVQGGEATLVVGGEVVDGKTTAPGEVRAPSIKGGERRPLGTGDIVHIPAKVPHQLLVASGKQFTYFVIKVDTP
jgi:mannose-6-phosphate isomerase-like protein (cupin superfamily)